MTTAPVMSITDEQIAELEILCEKAAPGPWFADASECERYISPAPNGETAIAHVLAYDFSDEIGRFFDGAITEANHAFMGAANPAVVSALISRLRAAEKDAGRYWWLCDSQWYAGPWPEDEENGYRSRDENWSAENLSRAIDAAMTGEKP